MDRVPTPELLRVNGLIRRIVAVYILLRRLEADPYGESILGFQS